MKHFFAVYYGQLFLYLLFLFFLTSYMLLVPNPALVCAENVTVVEQTIDQ